MRRPSQSRFASQALTATAIWLLCGCDSRPDRMGVEVTTPTPAPRSAAPTKSGKAKAVLSTLPTPVGGGSAGCASTGESTTPTPLATPDPGPGFVAGNICAGKSILGLAGTAECDAVCQLPPEKGTWDLRAAFPGGGTYAGTSNAPIAATICAGTTVLGVAGTAACATSFADVVPARHFRAKGTAALTLRAAASSGDLPPEQHEVPDITTDSDLNTWGSVTFVGSAGLPRPSVDCGASGTIAERATDCATKNLASAFWNARANGIRGESDWRLVVRLHDSGEGTKEVWQDLRTRLLWSDFVDTGKWCQAAGNVQSHLSTDCSPGGGIQPAPPQSLCAEVAGLVTPATTLAAKGNLTKDSVPSVRWRLPTRDDWFQGFIDGQLHVLPNAVGNYWTASRNSSGNFATISVDDVYWSSPGGSNSVRCVGRVAE